MFADTWLLIFHGTLAPLQFLLIHSANIHWEHTMSQAQLQVPSKMPPLEEIDILGGGDRQ